MDIVFHDNGNLDNLWFFTVILIMIIYIFEQVKK